MRVVVDIPPDLVEEIRETLRESGYEDPEQFLLQALRTQLELESGGDETLMSFGEAIEPGESHSQSITSTEQSHRPSLDTPNSTEPRSLPRREFDIPTVDPPVSGRIDTGPLWGQYNRIFPMKLSLRNLAIWLDDEKSRGAPYEAFRDETAEVAREYGLWLAGVDERLGRGRGERFSAALPTGDKVDRSLDRFKTHFVGQMDSEGNLTGSLPNLLFVDIDPETREFGITEAGLDFARLQNPLLDGDDETVDHSLSEAEREFYLDHVDAAHEEEAEAMRVVARAINEGIDRPDPLSERVGELSEDWSNAQASTVRSGLVGRLHELELVRRERVGSRGIRYELTPQGLEIFL
jgi:hypothetical protein